MLKIEDITFKDDILNSSYDASFFASGYEERCCHIFKMLDLTNFKRVHVIGFKEQNSEGSRTLNDLVFKACTKCKYSLSPSSSQDVIVGHLRNLIKDRNEISILVDYSSMSKQWISSFLSWAAAYNDLIRIRIDFVYSIAEHREGFYPLLINSILPLAGFEGFIHPHRPSVILLNLGFDGSSPICVLDKIEPDLVYTFYADPGSFDDYASRSLCENKNIIENHSSLNIPLSIFSMRQPFTILSECISLFHNTHNINLVPMGPKPHALAMMLAAYQFKNCILINVSGRRTKYSLASPAGEIICSRVSFLPTY
jgi:hypothetical protein